MRTQAQQLGADIRWLEQWRRDLLERRRDLTCRVIVCGPADDGRDAFRDAGGMASLRDMIAALDQSIVGLVAELDALEMAEAVAAE